MDGGFWCEQKNKRVSGFKAMNLKPELLRGIFGMGLIKPWPVQEKSIHLCLKGKNVFASAQPGCGKSTALCISVLQKCSGERKGAQIIVVAATNKLAQKITDTLHEMMKVAVNEEAVDKEKEEGHEPFSNYNKWSESTNLGSSPNDSGNCDWSEFKKSFKREEAAERPQTRVPAIIVNTHEGVLEMVRSNKIDLSTVKLFVMDEPSAMLAKRSRQVIEFAEIKAFLPKNVQVLVFYSSLPGEVLKACSKCVSNAEFIDCGKDKRVIQGIDQLYVSIQEEVDPEGQVIGGRGGKDAAANIERIFKCKSYYDIFGVSKKAVAKTIRNKYKQLCKKFHPDKCADIDSTEVFKLINYARVVLLDDNQRKNYDCGGNFPKPSQFKPLSNNPIYRFNSALKLSSLVRILKSLDDKKKAIVFCNDPEEVSVVGQKITERGYIVAAVHDKMSPLAQDVEMSKFCDGSVRFLVTTTFSVRAMKTQYVKLVINYDLPANSEEYVRRLTHFGSLEQREGTVINFIKREAEKELMEQYEAYFEIKIEERHLNNVFKTCSW